MNIFIRGKREKFIVILLFIGTGISGFSQEILYKAGLHSFFDNNEFADCQVGTSQTMTGVHLVPQIGLSWDTKHRIFIGIDAMHEFGSEKMIDYHDLIAYYEYESNPFRFYMGAFPGKMVLDKYPRFFFEDSILNYRPVINGLFWEYNSKKGDYVNMWLDWTSRQTFSKREAFFMGWSGRKNYDIFYGQHFGYMYHFAGTLDPDTHTPVYDNGRIWTAFGLNLTSKIPFDEFDINAGWAIGLERNRADGDGWYCPQGFLSQINIEYKGVGMFNTYYKGGSQGKFYDQFGSQLYWNDRLYRATQYDRVDSYLYFLKTDIVTLKFIFSLHFLESGMYTGQQFYASFDLDNLHKRKSGKKYQYLWNNWVSK